MSCIFRNIEQIKRKERSEAHLYMSVEVLCDDDLQLHHGPDLIDIDDIKGRFVKLEKEIIYYFPFNRQFKVLKVLSFDALHIYIADTMARY